MIHEDGLISLAKVALENGDFEQAFGLYEKELAHPNQQCELEIKKEFAFLLWDCYQIERASQLFSELTNRPEVEPVTLQMIAKQYFRIGRYEAAVDVMQRLVLRDQTNAEWCTQLASCLERSDQLSLAIEMAEQALACDPANNAAIRQLARIDRREGNFTNAVSRLSRHLTQFASGETWLIRYELAASLDRIGEYDLAWQELLRAKSELARQSRDDLAVSYVIRKRQGELAQAITDSDLRRWHQLHIDTPQRIAFLAGFPRSGTTLLESILTSHPQVVGTDETGILSSQFIRPIIWDANETLDALLEIRGYDQEQITQGRETYLKFTSAVSGEEISTQLLIEKDPLLTCDLPIPLRLFPEAKIIMPLRDPRDVVISYFFTMVPLTWNSAPAMDIVESARFYHDVMRHWLLFRKRLPWESIETRYEDLVEQPGKETRRLSEFLNVDFRESMLEPKSRSSQKWITTPTYEDITKPIYNRSVSRWKNYRKYLEPALPILDSWASEFGYV